MDQIVLAGLWLLARLLMAAGPIAGPVELLERLFAAVLRDPAAPLVGPLLKLLSGVCRSILLGLNLAFFVHGLPA